MSQNQRGYVFQSRWGQATVNPKKRIDKSATLGYINRMISRMNKAAGHASGKKLYEWHYSSWCVPIFAGMVIAYTKSEARALVKKELGIPKKQRIPKGVSIFKGEASGE